MVMIDMNVLPIDYEGYSVSDTGVVFTPAGKEIPQSKTHSGYSKIPIFVDGKVVTKRVHRLVAAAFLTRDAGKNEVNHKDGDKTNNRLENLEWVSRKENMAHAFSTGLCKALGKGENSPRAILTSEQVAFIRSNAKKRDKDYSLSALAKKFGVSVSCVHLVVSGRNWSNS